PQGTFQAQGSRHRPAATGFAHHLEVRRVVQGKGNDYPRLNGRFDGISDGRRKGPRPSFADVISRKLLENERSQNGDEALQREGRLAGQLDADDVHAGAARPRPERGEAWLPGRQADGAPSE